MTTKTTITVTADDVRAARHALQGRIAQLDRWLESPMDTDDSMAARAAGMVDRDDCRDALKKFDAANRRIDKARLEAVR
jgi:hypothetical protein